MAPLAIAARPTPLTNGTRLPSAPLNPPALVNMLFRPPLAFSAPFFNPPSDLAIEVSPSSPVTMALILSSASINAISVAPVAC